MRRCASAVVTVMVCVSAAAQQRAPVADHHQHLASAALSRLLGAESTPFPVITARHVIVHMDSAGIQRAAVLSLAYMYGSPSRKVEDEYAKVRAENDWTGAQA